MRKGTTCSVSAPLGQVVMGMYYYNKDSRQAFDTKPPLQKGRDREVLEQMAWRDGVTCGRP